MPAILFGSISTVADTSELQRRAYNAAFEAHGLDWSWDRDEYLALLKDSGGQKRIAEQARSLGQDVDAEAVHETKSKLFQESLGEGGIHPRDGVVDTIRDGRDAGFKIALVTTTAAENISALVEALGPDVRGSDFDLIVDSSKVKQPKPDAAAYTFALDELGEMADHCTAIEDNVGGVASARAAGLTCSAFPNENTAAHDFGEADHRVDRLSFAELRASIPGE